MTLDEYIDALPTRRILSEAKRKILISLWGEGESFPGIWVKSSYLLELTGQKYFDRRARELRDELGCDIETRHYDGEHCWRLNSTKISQGNTRQYLSEKQKQELFNSCNYQCTICGKETDSGVRGLQADHKVPLIRGGSHEFSNWQAICNQCNVGKRRACMGCHDDCYVCPWAYPEKTGILTTIQLPHDLLNTIKGQVGNDQTMKNELVIKALEFYFKSQ